MITGRYFRSNLNPMRNAYENVDKSCRISIHVDLTRATRMDTVYAHSWQSRLNKREIDDNRYRSKHDWTPSNTGARTAAQYSDVKRTLKRKLNLVSLNKSRALLENGRKEEKADGRVHLSTWIALSTSITAKKYSAHTSYT